MQLTEGAGSGAYPIATDVVTAILLYMLGKITSDAINRQPLAKARVLGKWGVLGCMDGLFTGMWYRYLEASFCGLEAVPKCLGMLMCSSFLYTPAYTSMFVAMSAVLDGMSPKEGLARFKRDVVPLTKATFTTWAPLNLLLFGFVPVQLRVVVSMAAHYVYLVFLAMWDSGFLQKFIERNRSKVGGASAETADEKVREPPWTLPTGAPATATPAAAAAVAAVAASAAAATAAAATTATAAGVAAKATAPFAAAAAAASSDGASNLPLAADDFNAWQGSAAAPVPASADSSSAEAIEMSPAAPSAVVAAAAAAEAEVPAATDGLDLLGAGQLAARLSPCPSAGGCSNRLRARA